MCEQALKFDDYWIQQPCTTDRMAVLSQLGEWFRSGLSPISISSSSSSASSAVEREARSIYPKYYAHFMSMSGPPAVKPTAFFDLAGSKRKHASKPILLQKLAIANDAFQSLFQYIATKTQQRDVVWKKLHNRFQQWHTDAKTSFNDQDMSVMMKNNNNTNDHLDKCVSRFWPLFATIALARGLEIDLPTTSATSADAKSGGCMAFVAFEDPQMGMAKLLKVPGELCVGLFELLEIMRAIHDSRFADEFEIAISQLAIQHANTVQHANPVQHANTTTPLPILVMRLALEAFPIAAPFYQKQSQVFKSCIL